VTGMHGLIQTPPLSVTDVEQFADHELPST